MSIAQFKRRKIQMMLVAKRQNIILNKIPERKSMMSLLKVGLTRMVSGEVNEIKQLALANLTKILALTGNVNQL